MLGTYDHYIGGDHAWGGGGDIKYFFCRYAGLGVEGFALDASKPGFDIFEDPTVPIFVHAKNQSRSHHRLCFRNTYTALSNSLHASCALCMGGCGCDFRRRRKRCRSHTGAAGRVRCPCGNGSLRRETKVVGQFGAGLEFRFSRHIGWTNDLSFGVIDGPQNNFGMFRSGLNFAF